MKQRIVYEESYRKPYPTVKQDYILGTTLPHLAGGGKIHEIGLMKAGTMERDGKRYEFQDLRVLIEFPEAQK